MVDLSIQNQAVALAGVAAVGAVAFVVGSALWASNAFGVWAGVTVGGAAVTVVAAVGLYTVGTAVDQARDERQKRF